MNKKWSKLITENEKVVSDFGVSNSYLFLVITTGLVAGFFVYKTSVFASVTIVLLSILYAIYLKISKHYILTNKRVIIADTFPGTNIISINYKNITDIVVEQNLPEQILFFGNLSFNSAGTNSPIIKMIFLDNPEKIKQKMQNLSDETSTN